MICAANWESIEKLKPPLHKTVLLYQKGDLYPVVGERAHGHLYDVEVPSVDFYTLEEGGPEDGEHRSYPILEHYKPTHWCELPEVPFE